MEEAADGQIALDLLQRKQADLVITDVNMPNMDGIELTRQLRALPSYRTVPIVLLTTETDPAKKNAGRSARATGWIKKPFSQDQLLGLVSKIFSNN